MKKGLSKTARRLRIVINYASLVLLLILFYLGKHYLGWSSVLISALAAAFVLTLVTFISVHVRTGLWRLTHTKVEELDEREIQVTHESLRHSYSFLTIILAIIIFTMALIGKDVYSPLLPASLIYFAHTLPSSVIAWTENVVSPDN